RLQAVKFIQGANAQPRERRRLAEFQRAHRRDLVRQQLVGYTSGALPGFILSLGTAAVFLAGSYQVIEGRFTLGALIAFTAYLARAFAPLRTLLGIGVGWQRARVSLERLAALTDPVSPLHDGAGTLPPVRVGGELAFAGVTFAYPGTDRPVLEGFDARIEPGAKVLVHGPSGAGKSTLVDLLHRHYDPDAGAIRLDGVDLRDCRLDALRREVAVVSQEAVLFDATLRENVAYAVPEADDALVRAALGRAQLGAWLETLPEGLDTRVGTRGTALSGGQRQRVAIARALLQRPRVLVFDEATSALDEATERALLDVIDRLFSSCTRLVVTHRLHAVREPDHVITLAGGEAMALAG
ncbi:MAG: ABC transporter ATP-binding protein, partial [Gammaproteobacteria bacterium]|nr:ABC transporter ATP-binding protein [Gammaproteobacteria bacterium]